MPLLPCAYTLRPADSHHARCRVGSMSCFFRSRIVRLPDKQRLRPRGLRRVAPLQPAGPPRAHSRCFVGPRGQLPYIVDQAETIGDSDTIIAHLIRKYCLTIDEGLTPRQRDLDHLITRMLDDLYWVMSYSRWKNSGSGRFPRWPARAASDPDGEGLNKARGSISSAIIFRASAVTSRGGVRPRLADLEVPAHPLPRTGYLHGASPTGIDAGIYGFIANIRSTQSTRR